MFLQEFHIRKHLLPLSIRRSDECERFSEYPEHKDTLKIKCFQRGREVDCSHNIVVGTEIKLDCAPGTTLNPKQRNDTVTCQPNSQWSSKIYSCVKSTKQKRYIPR